MINSGGRIEEGAMKSRGNLDIYHSVAIPNTASHDDPLTQ